MFCYQCEQAIVASAKGGQAPAKGGCTRAGNCCKDRATAELHDQLLAATIGMSVHAHRARQLGKADPEIDRALLQALYGTLTNIDFDPAHVKELVRETARHAERARQLCDAGGAADPDPGALPGLMARLRELGPDLTGLQELLTCGVKGAAAYAEHARLLGLEDPGVIAFFHEALAYLAHPAPTADDLLALCIRCGQANLRAMELLDRGHTRAYGDPVPTPVRVEPLKGKAILVSGHDLGDLEALLRQTSGKGINVYTHGEMLPAHGYPGLKKHPHLAGNYGGAWQTQNADFEAFPGAIVMTSCCMQPPQEGYKGRIFTTGHVACAGVRHVEARDFSPVVEAALAAPGFAQDGGDRTILVGFGRQAVLAMTGKIADAIRSGALRHLFLVAGCDGARVARGYYTELVESVPRDCAILTFACGKYRFNKLEFGEVAGIPRLIDVGQCNDAYAAIQIARALAEALGTDVNGLPLSLVLSWFEQKAVAILLTLLSLGFRNIRLGPTLPAFLTDGVLERMAERFALKPITTARADLEAILG